MSFTEGKTLSQCTKKQKQNKNNSWKKEHLHCIHPSVRKTWKSQNCEANSVLWASGALILASSSGEGIADLPRVARSLMNTQKINLKKIGTLGWKYNRFFFVVFISGVHMWIKNGHHPQWRISSEWIKSWILNEMSLETAVLKSQRAGRHTYGSLPDVFHVAFRAPPGGLS